MSGRLPTKEDDAAWTPHGDGRALTPDEFSTWNPHDGGHPYNPHCFCDSCMGKWRDKEATRSSKLREISAAQYADMTPEQRAELAERLKRIDAEDRQVAADIDAEKLERRHLELLAGMVRSVAKKIRAGEPAASIDAELLCYVDEVRDFSKELGGPKNMAGRIHDFSETGLRPPVISQLIRAGECGTLVSETKVGKSWLAYNLAICTATGRPWLGRFCTEQGRVLYLDNELHEETTNFRFIEVAKAMALPDESNWADNLDVMNLRGKLMDIVALGGVLLQFQPNDYRLIILDAGYRALPKDADENSNGDMTTFQNLLDSYAMRLNCAIVMVDHSSKGAQGQKRLTDVGSGAGAKSRATDCHMVMRAHQQDDVFVFDAAIRSWPRLQPFCLRWNWPLWTVDDSLDPADLRTDRPRKPAKVDVEGIVKQEPWSGKRFAAEFCTEQPLAKAVLIDRAIAAGVSERTAARLIASAEADGLIHQWPGKRIMFATVKPPELPLDVATATDSPATATKKARVVAAIEEQPDASDQTIAEACDCSRSFVQKTRNSLS